MKSNRKQTKLPKWLPRLTQHINSLKTAHDWLRVLTILQRRMDRRGLYVHEDNKGTAIITSDGGVGQVGGPYDYFLVNLSAPDGVLQKEFRAWLKEKRQEIPPPVKNRGPNAHASQYGQTEFGNWRDLRIVEYGALLVWREWNSVKSSRKITDAKIGDWIGRHGSNDRQRTKDRLIEVLKNLPALAAQAGSEMSG